MVELYRKISNYVTTSPVRNLNLIYSKNSIQLWILLVNDFKSKVLKSSRGSEWSTHQYPVYKIREVTMTSYDYYGYFIPSKVLNFFHDTSYILHI